MARQYDFDNCRRGINKFGNYYIRFGGGAAKGGMLNFIVHQSQITTNLPGSAVYEHIHFTKNRSI